MDKSCQSSSSSSSAADSSRDRDRDQYLRHLNKLSQKISKPIINKKPTFDHQPPPPQNQQQNTFNSNSNQPQNHLQHQPPVYNINKSDFRDVVQKLTGSPAHERISSVPPPPIQQPKPQSSRLQRIRPPPLPQITNRPPPLINVPPRPFNPFGRPSSSTPLSPLPPFPTVHAPAESPISAYLRDLQNLVSTKNFSAFSPLPISVSPPPQAHTEQQHQLPAPSRQQQEEGTIPSQTPIVQSHSPFQMPTSPSPFGCLNSQLASYPLLSPGPGLLFSPNSGNLGFPQLPLSPTVPVPSPRWRDV